MGISPQDFRIRIGHFQFSRMKQHNIKTTHFSVTKMKSRMATVTALFLLCCLVISPANLNCSSSSKQGVFKTRTFKQGVSKHTEIDEKHKLMFCWAHTGLQPNKLQKIINGNRRSIGYKLAMWNCGRGLMQEEFSSK